MDMYNDIARGWLGDKQDSVICFFETTDSTDRVQTTGLVRVQIDLPLLIGIQRTSAFCTSEDELRGLPAIQSSVDYDMDDMDDMDDFEDMMESRRTETHVRNFLRVADPYDDVNEWYLNVSKNSFYIAGGDVDEDLTSSDNILISELGRWLKGKPLNEPSPGIAKDYGFCWYGGCLVRSSSNLKEFLKNVVVAYPEVGAKERELKMAARIRAPNVAPGKSASVAAETKTRSRNRLGL